MRILVIVRSEGREFESKWHQMDCWVLNLNEFIYIVIALMSCWTYFFAMLYAIAYLLLLLDSSGKVPVSAMILILI